MQGAEGLDAFGPKRTRPGIGQPGQLHGDGGAARDHVPGQQVGPDGPDKGQGINPGMAAKMPVLGRDHHLFQDGRDLA